jgi:hypothetical protein
VHLPPPADRSHPKLRRGTPALDEREALRELADHVAPYTDIKPPAPAPLEPWYDTRFESPAEVHHDRVGAKYRQGPDPNYIRDDYTQMPAPPGPPPRLPRPGPAPEDRPPTYEKMLRAAEALGPLWPRPATPENAHGLQPELPAEPMLEQDLPTDAAWDPMVEQAFPTPAVEEPLPEPPGLDGLLNADLTSPPMAEDPSALAQQAFDEQMRQAFSPPPPEPDPWADGLPAYGGLEQHLLEPPAMMPVPSLCPDLPPM